MTWFNKYCAIVAICLFGGCGFGKQAQLDQYVAAEKQNLPKVLFADVKVVDMAARENELIYYCDASEMDSAVAVVQKDKLLKKAKRYISENRQGLQRLIDAKIKLTFVARTSADTELFRVSINPWEL